MTNEHLEQMKEQDRVWKERRLVSGHGAQDGSAVDPEEYLRGICGIS